MPKKHNGAIAVEEFTSLTMAELYNMVEQSGEELFCLALNGSDGEPFCMFALAIADVPKLKAYAQALSELKPTSVSAEVGEALQ